MGRAVLQRLREETLARPKIFYFGALFDKEGKDCELMLQEKVYSSWDQDPHSPPSTREREKLPDPTLQILGWTDGHPFFPETLIQKFAKGTLAYKKVEEMKSLLEADFPSPIQVSSSGRVAVAVPRAAGKPDFSIEGGKQPVDPLRCIDLEIIPAASFTEPRLVV